MQTTIQTYPELQAVFDYLAPSYYQNWARFIKDGLRSQFQWGKDITVADCLPYIKIMMAETMPYPEFVKMVNDLFGPVSAVARKLKFLGNDSRLLNDFAWRLNEEARLCRSEFVHLYTERDFITALQAHYERVKSNAISDEEAKKAALLFEKKILKSDEDCVRVDWAWKATRQSEYESSRYWLNARATIGPVELGLVIYYYFYTEDGFLKANFDAKSEFSGSHKRGDLKEQVYVWYPVSNSWEVEED